MFDRLLVSTKDRRKGRTGKFLFVTSLFYSLALASVLVVSVLAASPQLYEKMDVIRLVPIPPPPPPPRGPRSETPTNNQQAAAKPDMYKVQDLETISHNTSTNQPPVTSPPSLNPIGDFAPGGGGGTGQGVPGGNGQGNGDIGVAIGGREIELPPSPVQKPVEKPQPPVEKQIVRLASQVLTGKALERRTPAYPPLAKQVHVGGSVTVEIVISPDGRVESARALGGHPLLMSAAVEAARGWRFQPTLLNGVAVRATGVITFNFTLE